jgi:hypothetical protein
MRKRGEANTYESQAEKSWELCTCEWYSDSVKVYAH